MQNERTKEQREAHTPHTQIQIQMQTHIQSHKRSFVCILDLCVCASNLCGIENFSRFDILTLADKIYVYVCM